MTFKFVAIAVNHVSQTEGQDLFYILKHVKGSKFQNLIKSTCILLYPFCLFSNFMWLCKCVF